MIYHIYLYLLVNVILMPLLSTMNEISRMLSTLTTSIQHDHVPFVICLVLLVLIESFNSSLYGTVDAIRLVPLCGTVMKLIIFLFLSLCVEELVCKDTRYNLVGLLYIYHVTIPVIYTLTLTHCYHHI